ncbi:hypothetical protein ACOTB3_24430 [Achromobacter xylosoxidans]
MIVFVDAGEAGVSGQMGVHGAQNREIGIVIDYDTIPPPGCDAGPARRKPRQGLRRKKKAAMKAASFRCGGARGNLAARNKDLNNLAGTWLQQIWVVG